MQTTPPSEVPRITARLLALALAGVIAVFAVANIVVGRQAALTRAANREIVGDALKSVELASRIEHDMEGQQVLVDAHIVGRHTVDMKRLERDIAERRQDLEAAARAYEPIATFPGAREAWERAKSLIAELEPIIDEALSLSRNNAYFRASLLMASNAQRFEALDEISESLVAINRGMAERSAHDLEVSQEEYITVFRALTVFALPLASAGVIWVRVARRREALSHRLASGWWKEIATSMRSQARSRMTCAGPSPRSALPARSLRAAFHKKT
jgi:hypothetical protein